MKIKIKADASAIYIRRLSRLEPVNWKWIDMIKLIEDMTIEVETDYLFKDQFNTVPIKGVSKSGMRIMENMVEEVIDDVRPGKTKCRWCGEISDKKLVSACCHCGEEGYLEDFF